MYKSIIRMLSALAVAVTATVAFTAAPAQAAWSGPCYDGTGNTIKPSLPGKTDVWITGYPCVKRDGSKLYAYIDFGWVEANIPATGSGHKFDDFEVIVNLERRVNGDDVDRVVTQHTCDYTTEINAEWDGHLYCKTDVCTCYDAAYNWSADGYFRYDIDNDGEGVQPLYFLTGSPLLY